MAFHHRDTPHRDIPCTQSMLIDMWVVSNVWLSQAALWVNTMCETSEKVPHCSPGGRVYLCSLPSLKASASRARDLTSACFEPWPLCWVQWLFIVLMGFVQIILCILIDCLYFFFWGIPCSFSCWPFGGFLFFGSCDINPLPQTFKRFFSHTALLSFKSLKL